MSVHVLISLILQPPHHTIKLFVLAIITAKMVLLWPVSAFSSNRILCLILLLLLLLLFWMPDWKLTVLNRVFYIHYPTNRTASHTVQ